MVYRRRGGSDRSEEEGIKRGLAKIKRSSNRSRPSNENGWLHQSLYADFPAWSVPAGQHALVSDHLCWKDPIAGHEPNQPLPDLICRCCRSSRRTRMGRSGCIQKDSPGPAGRQKRWLTVTRYVNHRPRARNRTCQTDHRSPGCSPAHTDCPNPGAGSGDCRGCDGLADRRANCAR
jgi:hypothetical protein